MEMRLTAPSLDYYVDVRVRNFGVRWLAVAEICGEYEIGLGETAREAVRSSLDSLGDEASEALIGNQAMPISGGS